MAASVKKKGRNQRSPQRKRQMKRTKQRKLPAKQRKKRPKQAKKRVKKAGKKRVPRKDQECQLTSQAKGVLGSCVEGLCKAVSSEAERLRKENCEPEITGEVMQTALEQSMSKENVRQSLTPSVKKPKKKKDSEEEKETVSSEKQKKLPQRRKRSATPMSNQ